MGTPRVDDFRPASGGHIEADHGRPTSGLRFCMITTFYPPYNFGGDGIGIQRFARALRDRGHHVTILHDVDAYLSLGGAEPAVPPGDDGDIEIHRLRSRLGKLACLLTQQTGRPIVHRRRLKRFFAEGRFDVINFHNVSLAGGPGILAMGTGLKLYMAHEHWLVCPSHVLWRHDREPCTGKQCLRCVLRYRRPPQLWRYTGLLNRNLRHIDAFIAMSEFSREKHKEFGFPREMEVVNYFLPDVDAREEAQPSAPPHPRPYFLFVGRLERIKGLDDVIPVFRDYPDADFVIAGSGEHEAALRRLAGDANNIHFLGRIPPEDLDLYYRHALSLIVPSTGFETFGIIIIEAFRQGLPVLARRIGPFPELIDRSQAGILFDGADDLRRAVTEMQSTPETRQRYACAARRSFKENWAESVVIPKYLGVVERTAHLKGRADIAARIEEQA